MRIAAITTACDPRRLEGPLRTAPEIHLRGATQALARAGHDVVVHGPDDEHSPAPSSAEPGPLLDPVPAGPLDVLEPRALSAASDRFAEGLVRRWRSSRPEVVHAYDWLAAHVATRALRQLGDEAADVPLVVSFTGLGSVHRRQLGPGEDSHPLRLAVERDLVRSADLLLPACVDQHHELLRLGASPDRTVPVVQGVDGRAFGGRYLPRRREPTTIVTVGSLAPQDGIEQLIGAVARLPSARLTVIGGPSPARLATDPRVAELRDLARRYAAADRVRFVGAVPHDEMPERYAEADLSAQVPCFASAGRPTVEALLCGLPVVATAVGGMLDSVDAGVNGLLVPVRDPHALLEALRRLLLDRHRYASFAAAARPRTLERYGWPRVTDATVAAYERAREIRGARSLATETVPVAAASA